MQKENKDSGVFLWLREIYQFSVVKRSIILWLGLQLVLWCVFALSYMLHPEAWTNVMEVAPVTAAVGGWWSTFLFIILNNLFICLLIAIGNIFVRFGKFTPGGLILLLQAVMIGWLAGANGFEIPFTSLRAANLQFLKVGLWETTAYAIICAVTLPKSLYISNAFPAREWAETKTLKEIKPSGTELLFIVLGIFMILAAGLVETYSILGN